jgi:hypothetical protein
MFCAPELVFGGTEGAVYRFHVLHFQTCFRRYRGCRVPFSCFALPDLFSTVPRASSPDYMFCAPGLVFDGSESVVPSFLFWHSQSRFQRYRGRRYPFSCFALPDSFSTVSRASCPVFEFCSFRLVFAVPRASGPSFMFGALGLDSGGTEGAESNFFDVSRSRTRFRRYRGCRVPFSSLALLDSFS